MSPCDALTTDVPACTRVLFEQTTTNTYLQAFCRSPLTDSNRRPPPYHGTSHATGRNPRQRFWLVFAASARIRFAADCDPLQPRGSIKAPSPRPVETALRGASSGSLSASLGHLA